MPVPKPTLDPDVEAFYTQLLKEGNLSEEEKDMLHSLLGKKEVLSQFKAGIHARSLTDRKLDEAKKEVEKIQKDYDKKLSDLVALENARNATASTDKTKLATLEKAINAKQEQLRRVRTKLSEYEDGPGILAELGLDKEESITSLPQPTPTTSLKDKKDETPSLTRDDVVKEISNNSRDVVKFQFELLKMRDKYLSLTGKTLDLDELWNTLEKNMKEYNNDYNKIFVEKYDIVNLQKAKDEEAIQARIDKAVADKLAEEQSKRILSSDSRGSTASESDFFKSINSTIPESEKKDLGITPGIPDSGSVIQDAVQHFHALREKKEQASI